MTLVRESAAKYGAEIQAHRLRGLRVLTDRVLLTDAVVNILTNAVDAMRGQDPTLHRLIHLRTSEENGRVTCTIANSGPPIPEAVAKRIFEFGFTTKHGNGRGIGLHFSKRIIESHGGSLIYEADPDGSPVFRIELVKTD